MAMTCGPLIRGEIITESVTKICLPRTRNFGDSGKRETKKKRFYV